MRRRSTTAMIAAAAVLALPALAHADSTTGGVGTGSVPGSATPAPLSTAAHPTVAGTRTKLIRGVAYAPAAAPLRVRQLIWSVNTILGKPYVYGGGHGSFNDRGYDCSGLVSYAMHAAGLLKTPMSAPGFFRFGTYGTGRWVTLWVRSGHVFAVVGGLRLDTTPYPSRGVEGPRWRPQMRDTAAFTPRHPAGL
jgi:NlpC/P60 family protein